MTPTVPIPPPECHLHAFFSPREIKNGDPEEYIFVRFFNKSDDDGASCYVTGRQHGHNIYYQCNKIQKERAQKDPDGYQDAAFLHFDKEDFLSYEFAKPEALENWGLKTIFEVIPDPKDDSPTHTLVRLASGLQIVAAAGEGVSKKNVLKVLEYKGSQGEKEKQVTRNSLKTELRKYFKQRWRWVAEAAKAGWLDDCSRVANGVCSNPTPMNCTDLRSNL
ncbi:MAG: hypothetical protein LBS31_11125 [Candidatus Adiutrix sp.]|jgi:hypothetical protein|nr:hypothetical protein [Candidatus Adiutrix sp.]